jgi:hypothetical protein
VVKLANQDPDAPDGSRRERRQETHTYNPPGNRTLAPALEHAHQSKQEQHHRGTTQHFQQHVRTLLKEQLATETTAGGSAEITPGGELIP